jgi:hypothetical protein
MIEVRNWDYLAPLWTECRPKATVRGPRTGAFAVGAPKVVGPRRALGGRARRGLVAKPGWVKRGAPAGSWQETAARGEYHQGKSDHEAVGCGANTWMPEPLAGWPQGFPGLRNAGGAREGRGRPLVLSGQARCPPPWVAVPDTGEKPSCGQKAGNGQGG